MRFTEDGLALTTAGPPKLNNETKEQGK